MVDWASVAERDHLLEGRASRTSESLAKHRWHWTLDESNPDRVPVREYARAVGRAESGIRKYVNGYADFVAHAGVRTLVESIDRAGMGADTLAATDAIAKARGTTSKTARMSRPTEVRRVREMARDRAEKHGTTVEEEAQHVADWAVKAEKSRKKQTEDRKAKHTFRFISIEGDLAKASRILVGILREAEGVEFTAEERELLADTVNKLKALMGLIDMRFVGTVDVDWDAELSKITGEV